MFWNVLFRCYVQHGLLTRRLMCTLWTGVRGVGADCHIRLLNHKLSHSPASPTPSQEVVEHRTVMSSVPAWTPDHVVDMCVDRRPRTNRDSCGSGIIPYGYCASCPLWGQPDIMDLDIIKCVCTRNHV